MPFATSTFHGHLSSRPSNGSTRLSSGPFAQPPRSRLPSMSADEVAATATGEGPDMAADEDPRYIEFRDRFAQTEARILALFNDGVRVAESAREEEVSKALQAGPGLSDAPQPAAQPKRPARMIDEDDYGDDDDDDEEEDDTPDTASPLLSKSTLPSMSGGSFPSLKIPPLSTRPSSDLKSNTSSNEPAKSAEEIRKQAEEDKKALEAAAEQSAFSLFYTLENDRDAMIEQQKLDELDRQVENEVSGQDGDNAGRTSEPNVQIGGLSSADLGTSNLAFKHLIARIDAKRKSVTASDAQLRSLMSEVRKGRSKWASEEKVGQEELYEACEKVLLELKAQTEHAGPFLQRVNKREAPDYYNVIRHPMDIGTMLKKMKSLQYKSKKEFVDDLNLIWSNCLKYNTDPAHVLRKKALYMRKETEKLVPLIPDIVVRDRAEVEAEERRLQNGDAEFNDNEDSDEDEPIMASRGRKAPSKSKKGQKGAAPARKAPPALEGTPQAEQKPPVPSFTGPPNAFLRADSELDALSNGLSTPPPGTLTPLHGAPGSAVHGSQADTSEIDGVGHTENGLALGQSEEPDVEDALFKKWKQITKRARATVASERHRLFRNDRLNPEEPALLRSKAGMRKWLRQQRRALGEASSEDPEATFDGRDGVQAAATETLAEGMEAEEGSTLPDYYDPVSAIPELNPLLKWVEDGNGNIVDQSEEYLRMYPKGLFKSPESVLAKKIEANMRQMQETRKVCAKIGVVKQMQLQAQIYQNQFQKYDPQPFVEADIEPTVVREDGPIMNAELCRAALQRSVAEIFYHAGFEDTQPSALDAVTDIASDFFAGLVNKFSDLSQARKDRADDNALIPRMTFEETVLHTLNQSGNDLEAIEVYARDDMDRLNTKLKVMHERMKTHLAELLRPALDPSAGVDGAGAFNEGSEQFVQGDFAEEIGEDFFGFKELGLADELGLDVLSVPLHLLHNRMYNTAQTQNPNASSSLGVIMENPSPYESVTIDNVGSLVGIVQDWFRNKLHANNDMPLVEDDDLPIKQRYPKPRLPPNGKITSPRKRPLKEQQQMAKKKRKLEDGKDEVANRGITKPVGKLRLDMPSAKENIGDPEKDDGSAVGMMSPESLVV